MVFSLCCLSKLTLADTREIFQAQVTDPPRAFGYTLGDSVEQAISLQRGDELLTLSELPAVQREGRWVTRSHAIVHDEDRTLIIRYQLINAPLDVRVIELPELILQTNENVDITVPAWPFSIAPLIPGSAEEELQALPMQADWQPPALSTEPLKRRLIALAAALALVLLSWLLWWLWRNWRESHTLPFAQAYQNLRRARGNEPLHKNAESWLSLHEAFNRCGGRSVDSGSVAVLLANVPWLKPLESDIQRFYELSSERFFSPEISSQNIDLKQLAKRLYIAEKKHTGEKKWQDKNGKVASQAQDMQQGTGVLPP